MLFQEDMAKMRCQCGDPCCDGGVFFRSRCHDAPLFANYDKAGTLRLTCCECERPVAQIAVASKTDASAHHAAEDEPAERHQRRTRSQFLRGSLN